MSDGRIDYDVVGPEFWTIDSLHAFLATWRGEPDTDPAWWVCWDYGYWQFFFVKRGDPDCWADANNYRKLCDLGELGDPMPEPKYMMDEPPAAPWIPPWQREPQYEQLEMDL